MVQPVQLCLWFFVASALAIVLGLYLARYLIEREGGVLTFGTPTPVDR